MSRWPDSVRDPLPVGVLTEDHIDEALRLSTRYMTEPEDPAHNWTTFAALCASRAALIECAEALSLARIARHLAEEREEPEPEYSEFLRIGQEEIARKVARRVIDDLRRWLP